MTQLIQNTKEWQEWRKGGMGASDANIIMGTSKFMTVLELYKQKIGEIEPEPFDNFIQRKGHDLEIKGRAEHELEMMVDFPPELAQHATFPYLRSSLDGCSHESKTLLEIKYVGEEDFQKVKNGEILEQYKPQLMHQMLVTGYTTLHLRVITEQKDEEGKQIKGEYKSCYLIVEADKEYIENELLPKLFEFWECVMTQTPPSLSKDDILDVSKNKTLKNLFAKYIKLDKRSKELSAAMDKKCKKELDESKKINKDLGETKAEIEKNKEHCKMVFNDLYFNQYDRNGQIDYKAALENFTQSMIDFGIQMIEKLQTDDEWTFDLVKEAFKKQSEWANKNLEKFRKKSSTITELKFKKAQEETKVKDKMPEEKKVMKKKKTAKKVAKKKVAKKKATKKKK